MEGNIHDEREKGIIPRSVEALFDAVGEADENIEFTFKVSYVEIYMERIRDLLDDSGVKNNLTVREDKIKGIFVAGVTEEYVTSHEELLSIMGAGERQQDCTRNPRIYIFLVSPVRATQTAGSSLPFFLLFGWL
jgi:kinesin family member 5